MTVDTAPPVLLINPFYPIDENPTPPLGLAFLAGVLEATGIHVSVLDFVVFPYSRDFLKSHMAAVAPKLVGATSVTMTFDNAISVIRDVKTIDPEVVTVMGGPHVTFRAEETLAEHLDLDVVVIGEGEQTLVELVRAGTDRNLWEAIPGLVFRKGDGFRRTPPRAFADLDTLPLPARHRIPLGRYRALNLAISMTSSRGCPFKCIFCVGRKMVGAKVRYRDPVRVVDEMAYLAGLGFIQINMADDLFTAKADHCTAVCGEILRRGLKVKWTSFARVDTVSLPVLQSMAAAGCTAVSFGLETGNRDILKTIRKGITLEQVIAAVGMCNEAGILPHASFILGLPGETPETIEETMAFGRKLEAMGVSYGFHLLAPFPGTDVRDRSADYGIRILTDDWTQYHANSAIVETEAADKALLDRIAGDWRNRFDAYLGDIQRRMAIGEAEPEEAQQIDNLMHTILIYELMMASLMETVGTWPVEDPADPNSLETLATRLADKSKYNEGDLKKSLERSRQQGDLRCVTSDGQVRWEWVDYL
ncbi:MAG: B12-binding domain-containing radical SAM protein [Desulfobacterales bacterium]|nr:B12-binding domain-containing radical SAM protein [Desulfobacterales bacterium]